MKILLLPISFLHHIILVIRHKLYDWHILKSKQFDVPVIGVGNLALGGTGKTPHIEYLIELLSESYRTCVVSRGYGRKSKGFQLASTNCCAETIGDEPMQYINKYNDVLVAVDENRNRAIELMDTMDRPPELYLLDDAFQHRSTQAGLNLLLTAYDRIYCDDFLFPAGTLRDVRSAAKRADFIVVTKAPVDLTEDNKAVVIKKLKPLPHQKVFFSSMEYQALEPMNEAAAKLSINDVDGALLFCGIANPKPLASELLEHFKPLETIIYNDHHAYTENDIKTLIKKFELMACERKILVTTEKDYARITNSPYLCKFDSIPLFTIPIRVKIHQKEAFNKEILDYVRKDYQHG